MVGAVGLRRSRIYRRSPPRPGTRLPTASVCVAMGDGSEEATFVVCAPVAHATETPPGEGGRGRRPGGRGPEGDHPARMRSVRGAALQALAETWGDRPGTGGKAAARPLPQREPGFPLARVRGVVVTCKECPNGMRSEIVESGSQSAEELPGLSPPHDTTASHHNQTLGRRPERGHCSHGRSRACVSESGHPARVPEAVARSPRNKFSNAR